MKRRTSSVGPAVEPQSLQDLVESLRTKLRKLESKQTAFVSKCVAMLKERKLLLTARLSGEGGVVDAAFKREITELSREKLRIDEDIQYILELKELSQRGAQSSSGKALIEGLRALEHLFEQAKEQATALLGSRVSEETLKKLRAVLQEQKEGTLGVLMDFNAKLTRKTQDFVEQIKTLQSENVALERQLTSKIAESADKYEKVTIRLRREKEVLERQAKDLTERLQVVESSPASPSYVGFSGLYGSPQGLSATRTDLPSADTVKLKRKLIAVCKERDALKFWKESQSSALTLMQQMRSELLKCHADSQDLQHHFHTELSQLTSTALHFLKATDRVLRYTDVDPVWAESRAALLARVRTQPVSAVEQGCQTEEWERELSFELQNDRATVGFMELGQEIKRLSEENDRLKGVIGTQHRQIEAYDSEFALFTGEIAQLREQKTVLSKAKEALERQIPTICATFTRLTENVFLALDHSTITRLIGQFSRQIFSLAQQVRSLRGKLIVNKQASKQKNTETRELQGLLGERTEEVAGLRRKMQDLELTWDRKEREKRDLLASCSLIEEELRTLKASKEVEIEKIRRIECSLQAKAEESAHFHEQLIEEKEVSASLVQELQVLRKEASGWKDKAVHLQAALQTAQDRTNTVEREVAVAACDLKRLEKAQFSEKEALVARLSTMETDLEAAQKQHQLVADCLAGKTADLAAFQRRTETVLAELAAALPSDLQGDLLTRLRTLTQDRNTLRAELQETSNTVACLRREAHTESTALKLSKANLSQLLGQVDTENTRLTRCVEHISAEMEDLLALCLRAAESRLSMPRSSLELDCQQSAWDREREVLFGQFAREKMELLASNEAEMQYLRSQLAKLTENRQISPRIQEAVSTEAEELPNRAFYTLFRAISAYSETSKTDLDDVINTLQRYLVIQTAPIPFSLAPCDTKEVQTSFRYLPQSFISLQEDISAIDGVLFSEEVREQVQQSFERSLSSSLVLAPFELSLDLGTACSPPVQPADTHLLQHYHKLESDLAEELRTNSLFQQQLQLLKEELQQKDRQLQRLSEQQRLTANMDVLTEAFLKLTKALPQL